MKHIIGAKCCLGQPYKGVYYAPTYFRTTQNIIFDSYCKYQTLYDAIRKINNEKILTIGGDHSIGVSTVSAINDNCIKNKKKLSVIWVDAHADINTYKTSNSGNIHGMPVAFLLGLCSFKYLKFNNLLEPTQIHYIGLRDVEIKEVIFLKNLGINYYTANDVINYGIKPILKEIKNKVKNDEIHISFDVDALDPKIMPCTGTAVNKGLTLQDALKIISYFENVKTMDIAEFNPLLGDINDLDISMYVINKIIKKFANTN